ncbi:MAG: carbohydrate ABC transporter permease [Gammaproteobacteria bacterium]|nr:carbohydrate ABC transporter permease [Gammaproteobacteria bacterium]
MSAPASIDGWARGIARRAPGWLVNGALWLGAALTLFPLLWMLSVSLMPTAAASNYPPPILPARITLGHYRELFATQHLGRYFLNSLIVASSATLLALVFNGMAGYAFAKLRFRGREGIYRLLLAGLLVPAQVTMIPLFGLLKFLGLVNSYAGAIVPGVASIFGIFLVRQYALSIPDELLDAARLDGAGEWRIFRSVVVPVLAPILVTLGIFVFLATWNDFMWPLIVLSDRDMQTLPVALASLSREHVQDSELMMAGATVTVLPVLLLFLALQRFYLRGIMAGSVKG